MKLLILQILAITLPLSTIDAEESKPSKTETTTPAETRADTPKLDPQSHEGVWKPIAAVLGGVRLPPPALKAITLKITGDNYQVTVEGEKEPDKGTCTLDHSTTPKRMTIKGTEGPNRGKTFLAIFEKKDAGSMRVCYDLSGTDFPKEFKAPKGTQFYLVGYRRPAE